jgi:hypothetical protein
MARTPSELQDWGNSPEFRTQLWQFIADTDDGVAQPGPDDFYLACCLQGMWKAAWAQVYVAEHDLSPAEAEAKVRQTITDQRDLYASLAAEAPPATPAG